MIVRDRKIDCIKGLAIILMVIGHSGFPYKNWIYLFHMAIFIMVSGYCWNPQKIQNAQSLKNYIVNKLKTLYLPYVAFNSLVIFANNLLIDLGIYTNKEEFLKCMGGTGFGLNAWLTPKEKIVDIVKTMLFMGGSQLGGATWFLRCLFFVCVAHAVICLVIKEEKIRDISIIGICVCCFGVLYFIDKNIIYVPIEGVKLVILQFCGAYPVYVLGIGLRRYNKMKYIPSIFVLSVIVLSILNGFGKIGLDTGKIVNPIFYLICSLCGWYFLMFISRVINGKLEKILIYIGENSIFIVLWHFVAFKVVSWGYINVAEQNKLLLASFPVINNGTEYLWIIYSICGISIPMAIAEIYQYGKSRMIGKRGYNG